MAFYKDLPVLVTGGAGSIGGRLAALLHARGAAVVVVDDLSSGRAENIPPRVPFLKADITDAALVAEIFQRARPAVVFHLAAHFAHENSLSHPVHDLTTNGVGTLTLLACAAQHHVRRFVYASSSCILAPSDLPLTEEAQVGALETPYAISKYVGELYARFYADYHQLPVTVLRYFNSYGPGDIPGPYRSVIPNLLRRGLQGLALPITGTGEETRDFTYVDDVCAATLLAGELGREAFELYNVGSGRSVRILDLCYLINEITRNTAGVMQVKRRPWDCTPHRRAAIELATERLGYRPAVGLREGLSRTCAWLSEQRGRRQENWDQLVRGRLAP